jgi:hypothetical protein
MFRSGNRIVEARRSGRGWRRSARTLVAASAAAAGLASASCAEPDTSCGTFSPSVTYELQLQRLTLDVSDTRPVQGSICPVLPRECDCIETDENGNLRAQLPTNTDVLVEARAPGYVTTIVTTTTGTEDRFATPRVIDRTALSVLASLVGERLDASRGHLGMRLSAVEGADLTGTTYVLRHLDTGDEHRVIYTASGSPSLEATSTDETGVGLGVNLPTGRYRVESEAIPTCRVADGGWARFDADGRLEALELEVRAGAVTLIDALRCFGVAP